jgi:hypothetical protein
MKNSFKLYMFEWNLFIIDKKDEMEKKNYFNH